MERKIRWIAIPFILLLLLLLGIYFLGNRNINYSILFNEINSESPVQITGLEKTQTIEGNENNILMEISEYILKKDEANIIIKIPPSYKSYNTILVEGEFENKDHPSIEIGIQKIQDYSLGIPVYDWEWKTLDNKYLNDYKKHLGTSWNFIEDKEKEIILLQRNPTYTTISDFFNNPPSSFVDNTTQKMYSGISTIQTNLPQSTPPYIEKNASAIDAIFRGNVTSYVYYDQQREKEFVMALEKKDLNGYEGEDSYEVKIFNEANQVLFYQLLTDDGVITNSKTINTQKYNFSIPLPKSGLYRIEFISVDKRKDTCLTNFFFNSGYVSFNNFYLMKKSDIDKNITDIATMMYSYPGNIIIKTGSYEGSQQILINNMIHNGDAKSTINIGVQNVSNPILVAKNDIQIGNDTLGFSFSKEGIIPNPKPITSEFSFETIEKTNYIISSYNPNGAKKQKFNLNNSVVDPINNTITLKIKSNITNTPIIFKSLNISLLKE